MIVFDTEGDGLLDEITRFWVFGWTEDGKTFHSTEDAEEFLSVLSRHDVAVCHNCIRFDFPALKKVLGYDYKGLKVDSLAVSQYLYPRLQKHGLEAWGERLGIQKVYVDPDDWKNLDIELAKKRVTEDVKINYKLWDKEAKDLARLYS